MVKKQGKSGEYRSFTIEGSSIGFDGGKFLSKTPGEASTKVGRKLFRLVNKESKFARFKGDKTFQFILRETTQGSAHRVFAYEAHKKKLDTPLERKLPTGVVLIIEDEIKTYALKEHQVHDSLKPHLG
jgi:hypothetical protein